MAILLLELFELLEHLIPFQVTLRRFQLLDTSGFTGSPIKSKLFKKLDAFWVKLTMLTVIKKLLLFALTMHPTRKSGVVSISEYVAVSILFMELDEFPVIIEMMHQTHVREEK
jgi:hypothetical protein